MIPSRSKGRILIKISLPDFLASFSIKICSSHVRAATKIFCDNFIHYKIKYALRYEGLYGSGNMAAGIVAPI